MSAILLSGGHPLDICFYKKRKNCAIGVFSSSQTTPANIDARSSAHVLRHGRDVHPTWAKSSIGTLSNTRVWGSVVQGQSPKRTLTVTNERWLNRLGNQRP